MQTIKVRNRTTLPDFSALFRVALYLSGRREEAEENSFQIKVSDRGINRTIEIAEMD